MGVRPRLVSAAHAALWHFTASAVAAVLVAAVVFGLWYPYPYMHLSGGRELFLLVVGVDVVCGPLLTLVLFNPSKSRAELCRDLGLVALIQLAALVYGLGTVWEARPLFLVQEIDRFNVISAPDLNDASLTVLPVALRPRWWSGPLTVAIRDPKNEEERRTVLLESLQGGRDYAERPEFYLPYEGAAALKSLQRAKPLTVFLQKQPAQQIAADALAADKVGHIAQWLYLPVRARQDWVAVLDQQGQIQGFLRGDGF
ncbi:MAG: TfpX/TfpZ family type IV pilin accessory protein [Polaromonas sp.]|nr:TfpX/TfpZ family type IV pilin accessory protein [Polaromonas sp.]MDP3752382.1 TfpX/TfpZ family type IV pilin accessory protein [Polaromonas sp.]